MKGERSPALFRLALPTYLLLLFALATLGAMNQQLYRQQLTLMDQKEELHAAVALTRQQAATVNGPTAVANWASASGMVAVPEAIGSALVAFSPAPAAELPTPTLEVRTIWR